MFAVTTTPTSLSSSATRSLKNNKAPSLSKRAKCSSIVVSSSSSSSSSSGKNKMMDEKFDRREMLKNALVASVGVVAATPMPVRSFVRLVLPMISRVFMHFVVFRLDHQKAEKETTRKRVCGFDLSLFSLVSRTRKVRKRSKNVLTKRFFFNLI
jgi:hypothetical protein